MDGLKSTSRAHQQGKKRAGCALYMVRMEGLEPPRLAAPEPKSGASANFATSALAGMHTHPHAELQLKRA